MKTTWMFNIEQRMFHSPARRRNTPSHLIADKPYHQRWRRLAGAVLLGLGLGTGGTALAVSPDVVISQVYGGGGNSGATYTNDFIELHNSGASAVSLNGWSVQYASASGTTWQVTNLGNVTLQPGQYYLVQEAAGAGGTTALPTPDVSGSIAMSASNGKVALVTTTTALACGGTCATDASVRDYIGYGTATNFEGSGAAPGLSNTTADLRASSGCTDTDDNSADFASGTPDPRNTAVTVYLCSAPIINGVCGPADGQTYTSAPTTDLCTAGTPSAVSGTGPWTWTCDGSNGGTNASCSANLATGGPFTIFHMNDVHARVTPHKWIINKHSSTSSGFEDVGGAAYIAGELLSLTTAQPTALVLDGGDISEGNPLGDLNGTNPTGYGNGGMTSFYTLLANKLKLISGRGGRGIDALVIGNHDVRDASYITNIEQMVADSGIPVISANVRDVSTHLPHFPATTTVTVNGTKIGIVGYTTPSSEVGASLAGVLEVVQCDWAGSIASGCHIAVYVNDLRNNQGCDVVILLTHDGHSDLVNPVTPVIADTVDAQVPEIVVSGHWHTWAESVWQPAVLNYKTIVTESASYMKYIGELNVNATGDYVSSTQHVIRDADITPDPDVQAFVDSLRTTYNSIHPGHPVDEVVGYTNDALMLDNAMKWWSANEYPWSGNNTAGQWITDAMQWKCALLFGACDLAVEAGGGVRADISAGPVTWLQVYETFPWADDTYYRVNMTGQDIINFLNATNLDAGFSSELDVTAFDGVITNVNFNGAPIDLNHVYTVGINNYMYVHPPAGYVWPDTTPLTSTELVRESLADFMRQVHPDQAHAYQIGGDRYHFNGEYSGGYRAVVTMMNDNDSQPSYEDAFIRLLSANPETLGRRGSKQVPTTLVNADGSVDAGNRLAEQELYRSYLGFKAGALMPGDIIEVWGKSSFYGGNPEFVDQEGVYADGVEFKILGHDDSLAKPVYLSSIGALLSDNYKNHYVRFLARKTGSSTVADQFNQTLKIWDATGYVGATLPGNVGDTLLISGTLTMENYAYRFRSDTTAISALALPAITDVNSHINALPLTTDATITLNATAAITPATFMLAPVADAQVASGYATSNYGTSSNMYVQSSSTSTYGNERDWLKFDLSSIPASSTIAGAQLQLWNWKSTGAALPVEVRNSSDDSWTETGITWATQPASGSVLDTQTLAASTFNIWYNWDVGTFVQQEFAGDQLVSLELKAVTEDSTDATPPSYAFDAREYGTNAPVLQVTTQTAATSVGNVRFYYRYSADNASWGTWTEVGTADTTPPYTSSFAFPDGYGYYEFYSVSTDNLGSSESTPAYAQASVHYQAATGDVQSISFDPLGDLPTGSTAAMTATASSGLAVSFASLTTSICTVSADVVTAVAVGTCSIEANQSGDAGYYLPASATQSFAVTAAFAEVVPMLPVWALALLGAGLAGISLRRGYRQGRRAD